MRARQSSALLFLGLAVLLGIAYAAWVREVWVGHGADGIGRAAALATIVQAPLVVVSVGVAAWQVVLSARASRRQAEDAAALERARSRPYVAVSLDMDREWPFGYLDVANLGRTAARDVRVTIEPPLVTSLTAQSLSSRPQDARFLMETIGTLVPGQRLSTLVEMDPMRHEEIERAVKLEPRFVARVIYYDSIVTGDRVMFEDEFILNFDLWVDSTRVTRKTVHDLVDRVEKLTKAIEKR